MGGVIWCGQVQDDDEKEGGANSIVGGCRVEKGEEEEGGLGARESGER